MKSKNIIEINGKKYDANTGAPLHKPSKTSHATHTKTAKSNSGVSHGRTIDGFHKQTGQINRRSAHPKSVAPITHQKESAKQAPKIASTMRHTPKKAPLKARRSTTLNRSVVKVPSITTAVNVTLPTTSTAKQSPVVSSALKQSDLTRLKRAQEVSKSSVISRFNTPLNSPATTSKQPENPLTNHMVNLNHSVSAPHQQATEKRVSTKEHLVKKAIESASNNSVAPIHKKAAKKPRSKKSHFAQYTSTAIAALVLAGYVAYLNVPSISMKVAAHRAGFAATLPTYKPGGYGLRGPIAYSPGQVTLNFASNTDDRRFSLTQQPTTWDSTALLENYVTKQTQNYLTYQDRGLTIYIFNGSDAAWVNAGKLYHVKGENAQLDTDQLLKLATSV